MPSRNASVRIASSAGLVALLAVSMLLVPAAAGVRVLASSDEMPEPVYGYAVAMHDGKAYAFGGAFESRAFSDQIVRIDPDGTTTVVGELPEPLLEPAAATMGSRIYVFGGANQPAGGSVPTTTDTIYSFNPATNEIDRLIGPSLPERVSSAVALPIGSYIYILGGLSIAGGTSDTIIDWVDTIARFDPANREIVRMDTTLPSGRGQMSGVALDGSGLLFGGMAEDPGDGSVCGDADGDGQADEDICETDAILRFRPQGRGGSAAQMSTLPSPSRWSAAAVHEGIAYVLGGCQNNCGGHFGMDSIVAVDTGTGQADLLPVSMPEKGGRHSAVLFDDVATIPGGVRAGSTGSQTHDRILRIQLGPTAPWAPINLTATPGPGLSVRLDWQPPAYDGGAELTGYEVLRSTGAGTPTSLGEVTGTTHTDANVRSGTTYTYQVRAASQAGLGAASDSATITPTATPGAPGVSASGGNEKAIVQWTPPSDTGGSSITAYRIYAYPADEQPSLGSCDIPACWGELSGASRFASVQEANDEPLENGRTYAFVVQAQNENGWGTLSQVAQATPQAVPDPPENLAAEPSRLDGQRVVNLTWEASPSPDATGYVVYRGTSLQQLARLTSTQELSHQDTDAVPQGVELFYAVAAVGTDGEGPMSQAARTGFPDPPAPPANLTAHWTGQSVDVWWEPPDERGGGELAGYDVAITEGFREPDGNDTLHTVTSPPFQDSDPAKGKQLTYHVRAVGTGGASDWTMTQVRVPLTEDSISPKPALSATPTSLPANQPVTFDASGSSDDEAVVAYRFDFGDGQATEWRSGPRIEHAYENEGVYEATVHVRDTKGLESSQPAKVVIAVGPPDGSDDEDAPTPRGPSGGNGIPLPAWIALAAFALAGLRRRR